MQVSSPFSLNRQRSMRSATSEKIEKLVPAPSNVAPRGRGPPGQTVTAPTLMLSLFSLPSSLKRPFSAQNRSTVDLGRSADFTYPGPREPIGTSPLQRASTRPTVPVHVSRRALRREASNQEAGDEQEQDLEGRHRHRPG